MVLTCSASAILFLASPVPELFGISTWVGKWGLLYVRAVSGITVITGEFSFARLLLTTKAGRMPHCRLLVHRSIINWTF